MEEKLNTLKSQLPYRNKIKPSNISSPSQQQLNSLLKYYQTGQYSDAESLAFTFTQKFPKHPFGWKVLGAVMGLMGKTYEALNPHQEAVR